MPRARASIGAKPLAIGFLLLLVSVLAVGCAEYSGAERATPGAVQNVALTARSIDVQVVNTTTDLVFDEVGYGLESGEWVAEPQGSEPLAPETGLMSWQKPLGPTSLWADT